jgi:hypothetical protein
VKRKIVVSDDIAFIPLTQGYTAVIDAADIDIAEGYNWFAKREGITVYAARKIAIGDGKRRDLLLHRAILGLINPNIFADHHDGDGLNDRRANLRECSKVENSCNRGPQRNNICGLKGVSPSNGKWRAQISIAGLKKYLGQFDTPEAAHTAYCEAASELHGSFRRVA